MYLQHQALVDGLVRQHAVDFAALHADLAEAVAEVPSRWADRYPNPADMHGQNRCTSVRQTLFSIFGGRDPQPFVGLQVHEGPGMSVVLLGRAGSRIRVRRWPTDHFKERIRVVETPPPGQPEVAAGARQMTLDEGRSEPVFPRVVPGQGFDLYVLWWADSDESNLEGAFLAAVTDIDHASLVRILATAPLPPARPASQSATPTPSPTEPLGDFDEFDSDSSEESGTTPA